MKITKVLGRLLLLPIGVMALLPIAIAQTRAEIDAFAKRYFLNKPVVAIVVRISGNISAGHYRDLLGTYGDDTEEATENYERFIRTEEDFSIATLRTLKGDLPPVFTISRYHYRATALELGVPTLVFFEGVGDQGFDFQYCGVFHAGDFPVELLRHGTLDTVIDHIVQSGYHGCVRDHMPVVGE